MQDGSDPHADAVATALDEIARLLEEQGANPFRVWAYRNASRTLRDLDQPLQPLVLGGGPAALERLPGIGRSLSQTIDRLLHTGTTPLLERLRDGSGPERLFTTVPGIGPELARRIHEQLDIDDLVELHAAALDGRLAEVAGMGPKRIRAVRDALRARDARTRRPPPVHEPVGDPPPVRELLDVDAEYRRRARAGTLPRIAPRRFNPTHAAWLPILHTERHGRHYTALFSNTARAHELGTTHDWVVIYRDQADGDGRWTVVTAHFGPLRGRRAVRGRESEQLGEAEDAPSV